MIRPIMLIIWLTALICPAGTAYSQVNIEKIRTGGAETGFSTTLSLSLSARSGNVDLTTLAGEARTDFDRRHFRSFLLARGDMAWKDNNRFSNEGLIHARYTRLFSAKFDFEIFSQFNYDKSRLLDARYLAGGGVRINLFDEEQLAVAVGSAGMVEYERYGLPVGSRHPAEETVSRWSNYLNLKAAFGGNGSLVWIVYAQPRFDRFEDLRILSEATLAAGLGARLSLALTARIRYDHDPPDGIEDLDTAVLSSVQMEL